MPKPDITVEEAIARVGAWLGSSIPARHVRLRVLLGCAANLARTMNISSDELLTLTKAAAEDSETTLARERFRI